MENRKDNHINFVEFPAKDVLGLSQSKRFFSEAFGWSYQDWGDDYADTNSGGLGSGFNADPTHRPIQPLVVLFSSNLEATRDKVLGAGGLITRDIFSFPGGRRFHFKEPGGNELAVWSDK
ncbi:glyoxalase/bleomycin resistance/extradiol dioxygenase family protein [Candidatus Brocadia sapporoensis]|uniref:Glyoxalase/bleomycin resistance/extradiol dioxygenase family protein n=1 Tax=Candidatus Brocadia sapporoensis TaxID=392547 RepID=A0A1V6M317_9BACT|nr:VOC family protein [Candidatus Brocadia sapporoensis]MDG6004707.1 VOC family protein [Candidatus Brocadia sp.]OQD46775.1 glyoxalase/bleomycin resistance/extradiol dioxygenase family protein [Candidatus Brocadia sapporoensis]GJQ22739.1 MAG: glyoxalase [Candidatus Brocadia sapporoensis]